MSAETFARVMDGVHAVSPRPTVFFGGFGEPFAHPDLLAMLAEAKAAGCVVEMISNGTMLDEATRRELVRIGLDRLWVSIDGATPESYADVRLWDALPQVIEDLAALRDLRLASRSAGPRLRIAFVALGADLVPGSVPGLAEHGINVWDRAHAGHAHDALASLAGGRLLVGVFGTPYACPPGPYELALLADEHLKAGGAGVAVEVFGPMPIALPVVGPTESAKVEALLDAAGIPFHRGRAPVSVEDGAVNFADGSHLAFDLLFAVPPHRCPQLLVEAGLAPAGGWVGVDPATLATSFPGVYAIGDCTVIKLANGLPLPKAGLFAEAEGYVVAAQIAARRNGGAPDARFTGDGVCYAEVAGGLAIQIQGGFLADPPAIEIAEPSEENMSGRMAFEVDRLAAWFGR